MAFRRDDSAAMPVIGLASLLILSVVLAAVALSVAGIAPGGCLVKTALGGGTCPGGGGGSGGGPAPLSVSFAWSYSGFVNYAFTSAVSGGTPPYSYSWSFGDCQGCTTQSVQPNPAHSFPGAGLFAVTLTVQDSAGVNGIVIQQIQVTTAPGGGSSSGGGATANYPATFFGFKLISLERYALGLALAVVAIVLLRVPFPIWLRFLIAGAVTVVAVASVLGVFF